MVISSKRERKRERKREEKKEKKKEKGGDMKNKKETRRMNRKETQPKNCQRVDAQRMGPFLLSNPNTKHTNTHKTNRMSATQKQAPPPLFFSHPVHPSCPLFFCCLSRVQPYLPSHCRQTRLLHRCQPEGVQAAVLPSLQASGHTPVGRTAC